MKNRLLHTLIMVILGWTGLMAQGSGSLFIDIRLHPIQVLMINPSQQTVDLNYETPDDYIQGVSSMNEGHLGVFSTSAYEISVKAGDSGFLNVSEDQGGLPLDWLRITAILPAGNTDGRNASAVTLQTYQQSLISSIHADLGVRYDVMYQGRENQPVPNSAPSNDEQMVFGTRLIYSIMTR